MAPLLGITVPESVVKDDLALLKRSLGHMDTWLAATPFVAGSEVSIADLRSRDVTCLCVCVCVCAVCGVCVRGVVCGVCVRF
jgi:hypothetical protein